MRMNILDKNRFTIGLVSENVVDNLQGGGILMYCHEVITETLTVVFQMASCILVLQIFACRLMSGSWRALSKVSARFFNSTLSMAFAGVRKA